MEGEQEPSLNIQLVNMKAWCDAVLVLPGRTHLHHKEKHHVCKEKDLLALWKVLDKTSIERITEHWPVRLLKLVTGVDISTRPVRRSGNEGKAAKRTNRNSAAAPKRAVFRRSITIL